MDGVGLPAFPSRLPKRNNQDNSPAVEVGIRHQRVLEDLLGIVRGHVRRQTIETELQTTHTEQTENTGNTENFDALIMAV